MLRLGAVLARATLLGSLRSDGAYFGFGLGSLTLAKYIGRKWTVCEAVMVNDLDS